MKATRTQIAPITTGADIETEIAALANLDLEALRIRWRNLFDCPAPKTLPRALLVKLLAYRRQAEMFGDLDRKTILTLKRISGETPRATALSANIAARSMPPPGAMLLREWNGCMHRVTVMQNGFAWNGVVHASLSRIAREITGVNWNGFVFFGLGRKAGSSSGKNLASGKDLACQKDLSP